MKLSYQQQIRLGIKRSLFGSRNRLFAYFATSFSVGMTVVWYFLFRPFENPRDIFAMVLVWSAVSLFFGWTMASKFDAAFGYFLHSDRTVELAQLKYEKWFKNEEVPRLKSERAKYAEYLSHVENSNMQAFSQPMFLAFMYLYSLYIAVAGKGFHTLRLLAIFSVIILTLSFISVKRKSRKISRVKVKLEKASHR